MSPDLLVVGSGVAGLTAALEARALGLRVLVVTKDAVDDGSTGWAQGGVSVVLLDEHDPGDSVAGHAADTVTAGAGLCDPDAVASILAGGPAAVARLRARGARFDRDAHGRTARTREGGHSAFRVIHAGGDATGAEVERALVAAARTAAVPVLPHHAVVALRRDAAGPVAGAELLGPGGTRTAVAAGAVLLATGGAGRLYAATTNPAVATGDGLALALRAGASVTDVEFVQFHPTALWTGTHDGRRPLVTEAVRGEGAVLRDDAGRALMAGVHPLADRAPRDVVAAAITRHLARTGADHVWLDATALPGFAARFPTVTASCRAVGVDPARDPIPVVPAAHYLCGGVTTDADGRTGVPGLYAAGEVARTGLHGANRLASNSLLEGLVTGTRVAHAVAAEGAGRRPVPADVEGETGPAPVAYAVPRADLQRAASRHLAIGRDEDGLAAAGELLATAVPVALTTPEVAADAALTLVAGALVAAAAERRESRGCHLRTDHPDADPAQAVSRSVRLTDPADPRTLTIRTSEGARA